jgi:hypothetical protein
MAIPDAATEVAVSGSDLHFNPSNPAALGYDPSSPDFAGVREQAQGDADLAHAFRAELRRETARFGAWAKTWRRRGAGGGGWSGPPDPFTPARPEALLERASAALDHRRAWAASPTGVIARRLAEAEAAVQVLSGVLLEARAALERATAHTAPLRPSRKLNHGPQGQALG